MAEEVSKYPLVGFYFEVKFFLPDGVQIEMPFQELGGLKAELEFDSAYKEGGQNRYKHNLPSGVKYDDLTLKKGLFATPSGIRKWCLDAVDNFDFYPINLMVSLLNSESRKPIMSWQVVNAIPKIVSFSEFKAQSSEVVIETLVLSYNYYDIL